MHIGLHYSIKKEANEAAEKVYKDYCKWFSSLLFYSIIYIENNGDNMLKLNNQLELGLSNHSELYDILIDKDNFWR